MAYKTLIFGVDDMFNELRPYYAQAVKRGILEIVAYAVFDNNKIRLFGSDGKTILGKESLSFQLAIISSAHDFYRRMKFLETQGFARNRIIDGRVFKVPNLNFPRLLKDGIAYGVLNKSSFTAKSHTIYPQIYRFTTGKSILTLGQKSYITANNLLYGDGSLSVGNYSSIARNITFSTGQNFTHNYRNVATFGIATSDWAVPKEFYPPQGQCKIEIGNDVWIGIGCFLKSTNPKKPLVIGDGAVIAAKSVVVKNVPPYAIVGGNPAKIIKFRFSEDVIESFLRIKWWTWSMDKIYENYKYFNDIEKFISLHDK